MHTQEDLRDTSPVRESPITSPIPDANFANMHNISVCSACKSQYNQLVQYYHEYEFAVAQNRCSVCADIQDHVSKKYSVYDALTQMHSVYMYKHSSL